MKQTSAKVENGLFNEFTVAGPMSWVCLGLLRSFSDHGFIVSNASQEFPCRLDPHDAMSVVNPRSGSGGHW